MVGTESAELPALRAKVGWTLYHLGQPREALGHFEKAVRARPGWHALHAAMGWCYLRLGRTADARDAFQKALALRPDDPAAREGLKRTGARVGSLVPAEAEASTSQ